MTYNFLLTEEDNVDQLLHIYSIETLRDMTSNCIFLQDPDLRLTDVFIWEDLPHTEPDTRCLSMAAWIHVSRGSQILLRVPSLFSL
jgi:hypothetical protein